jgi:hypothetical protein
LSFVTTSTLRTAAATEAARAARAARRVERLKAELRTLGYDVPVTPSIELTVRRLVVANLRRLGCTLSHENPWTAVELGIQHLDHEATPACYYNDACSSASSASTLGG